jgi:hypothetical protein
MTSGWDESGSDVSPHGGTDVQGLCLIVGILPSCSESIGAFQVPHLDARLGQKQAALVATSGADVARELAGTERQ